jgi:hypothetical protein
LIAETIRLTRKGSIAKSFISKFSLPTFKLTHLLASVPTAALWASIDANLKISRTAESSADAQPGFTGECSVVNGTPAMIRFSTGLLILLLTSIPIASATPPPTRAEPLDFIVDEATLSAIGRAPRLLANLIRCHTNVPHTISHPYGKAAINACDVATDSPSWRTRAISAHGA